MEVGSKIFYNGHKGEIIEKWKAMVGCYLRILFPDRSVITCLDDDDAIDKQTSCIKFKVGDIIKLKRKETAIGRITKVIDRKVGTWYAINWNNGDKTMSSENQIELVEDQTPITKSNPNVNSARVKISDGEVLYLKENAGGMFEFMFERIDLGDTVRVGLSDNRILDLNNRVIKHYKFLSKVEIMGALTVNMCTFEDTKEKDNEGILGFGKCCVCREMISSDEVSFELPSKEVCSKCSNPLFEVFLKVCEKTKEIYNKFNK